MMKTGIVALGALSLINLAAAQPSNHRRHQQLHDKRQDVVVEVEYTYTTTELPKVVVFVDENNVPYSTSTEGQAAATSAASTSDATSVSAVSSSSAPAYTIDTQAKNVVNPAPYVPSSSSTTLASVYIPTSSSAQVYTTATPTSSQAAASTAAPSSGPPSGDGYGMVYSPYRADHTCKSQDEVNADFASINSWAQSNGENWNLVRSYGADCNQVAMMISAAKQYGVKIFAGVYNVMKGEDTFRSELNDLIAQVNGDWSMIHTISMGNEVVNNGQMTVEGMSNIMQIARGMLAGKYSGNIVAVDTFIAMLSHKDLCSLSDYPAVNAHPFFDVSTSAELAGSWVLLQMQLVSAACGGKDTWITETGWPTQGLTNGLAVPGVSEQKTALASIKASVSSNVIMLSAFKDMWKENNPSTFDAEQYWGICDN